MAYERKHRKQILKMLLKKVEEIRRLYDIFVGLNYFSEEEDALRPFNYGVKSAINQLRHDFKFLLNYSILYKYRRRDSRE